MLSRCPHQRRGREYDVSPQAQATGTSERCWRDKSFDGAVCYLVDSHFVQDEMVGWLLADMSVISVL